VCVNALIAISNHAAVKTQIQEAINNNWLQHQNGRFYASSLGMRFLNDLFGLFML
jgi:coproporphyrinogen III oxidase-like Fe-S oxidoreductase